MTKFVWGVCVVSLCLGGCETKAGTGALAGGGAGALAGGLITHSPEGALIGGAIGAVSGAVIGAALDSADRDKMQSQSPQTLDRIDHGQQLSVDDVKQMSKAGLSDDVIISQIHATKSVFVLSTADIIDLKNAGVSQHVIDAMVNTGSK